MEYKQASRHDSDNGIWDLVKWKNVIKCQNLLRTETHSSGFCITFAAALSLAVYYEWLFNYRVTCCHCRRYRAKHTCFKGRSHLSTRIELFPALREFLIFHLLYVCRRRHSRQQLSIGKLSELIYRRKAFCAAVVGIIIIRTVRERIAD